MEPKNCRKGNSLAAPGGSDLFEVEHVSVAGDFQNALSKWTAGDFAGRPP